MKQLFTSMIFLLVASAAVAHSGEHGPHLGSPAMTEVIKRVDAMLAEARRTANEDLYRQAHRLLVEEGDANNPAIRLKLAYLQQHFHRFAEALQTLSGLPPSPQMLLLRANIYLTTGELDRAGQDCAQLIGQSSLLLATTCLTQVQSLRGNLAASYAGLQRVLAVQPQDDADGEGTHWAFVVLADMAVRLGREDEAAAWYEQALRLRPTDHVTMMEYADLLLDQGRYTRVRDLLEAHTDHDGVFLRYIRAARALEDSHARGYYCYLKGNINRMKTRPEHIHYDLLAEYTLFLDHEVDAALDWARQQWKVQRTPRDARLLARAAVSAGDFETLRELEEWKNARGLEDRFLDDLLGN